MKQLILVRHAQTTIQPEVLSTEWTLSDEGIESARQLADDPVFDGVNAVYSSSQPKAVQTAEIIAGKQELESTIIKGLAELSSVTRGFIDDYAGTVHKLYASEIDSINGGETLDEARTRFTQAVESIVAANPDTDKVAVVSHANVLSLYSAQYSDAEAIDLHNVISMPDVAVLDWSESSKAFSRFWGEQA